MRDELVAYLVDLVRATRTHESVLVGAGPRATPIAHHGGRGLMPRCSGRDFVTPDEHQDDGGAGAGTSFDPASRIRDRRLSIAEVIRQILQQIAVPR